MFTIYKDLIAGLLLFLCTIPLCLWIAVASNVNPIIWLVASIIWWIVVWYGSRSKYSVTGAATWLIIVTANTIDTIGIVWLAYATVIAWLIQICAWYLKISKIFDYVPVIVIKWMLSWIGLIVIMKQLQNISWISRDNSIHIDRIIGCTGLLSLLTIVWRDHSKLKKSFHIPWSILGIVVGSIFFAIIQKIWLTTKIYPFLQIPPIDSIKDIVDMIQISNIWEFHLIYVLYGLMIATVASVLSLLTIKWIDNNNGEQTDLNRELKAQWIGNMISGVFGIPIAASITKSYINIQSGAQSKKSTIIHGILTIFWIMYLTWMLNYITLASLASVLIVSWYQLISLTRIIKRYQEWWMNFSIFLITLWGVVLIDSLSGVCMGIAVYYILNYIVYYKKEQNI